MSIESEMKSRLNGKLVLEAVADDEGNMIVNAPNIPLDQACKILASMLIDLLLQPKQSPIAKPFFKLPEGLPGGRSLGG